MGVAYADQLCGRFFDALDTHGVLDQAAVLVTSDHGEAFGEHGLWFRHVSLFEPVTRVPLILALPDGLGGELAGRRIDTPVSGIDVAPTIASLAGLAPPPWMRGRSLVAIAGEDRDPSRRVWFEHSSLLQAGFRSADDYFVDTFAEGVTFLPSGPESADAPNELESIPVGQRFLFDANAPADARPNRAAAEPATTAAHAADLARWMEALGHGASERAALTAEQEAQLRQLGYTGSGG